MIRRTIAGYGAAQPGVPAAPPAPGMAPHMPSGPVQKRKLDANGGIAPPAPPPPSPLPAPQSPEMAADPSAALNPKNAMSYLGEDAQSPHPDMAQLLALLQQGRR